MKTFFSISFLLLITQSMSHLAVLCKDDLIRPSCETGSCMITLDKGNCSEYTGCTWYAELDPPCRNSGAYPSSGRCSSQLKNVTCFAWSMCEWSRCPGKDRCVEKPTPEPTKSPTKTPTVRPTKFPTTSKPTKFPTIRPSLPTSKPTFRPTLNNTFWPTTNGPTQTPTQPPTIPTNITTNPTPITTTNQPSLTPTAAPTLNNTIPVHIAAPTSKAHVGRNTAIFIALSISMLFFTCYKDVID